jgi:hypothetical protein
MRLSRLASIVPALVLTAACSGSVEQQQTTSTGDGGSGGSGGTGGATTTTTSTTSAGGTGGTVDNGKPSTDYPAPHPAPPQVITGGGPVLKNPRVVPVFFSNDDATLVPSLKDFVSKLGATNYWKANSEEYGVGTLTAAAPVDLEEAALATYQDTAIETWLADKLNADDPAFPAPDDNTIYALHFPASTTITSGGGFGGTSTSCQDFGGYHSSITLDANHGSMPVAYAVIPQCPSFDGLSVLDGMTSAESHELLEAATDPQPMTNPAYVEPDEAHLYWLFALGGGETGDMCAQASASFMQFPELPYTVQRSWSNQAAAAGHDPCVPAIPGEVYFNTAPVLPDAINLSMQGQTAHMKGVKIPVGESKTIELDLFSDGDTGGPWEVDVKDQRELMGQSPNLTFSLDRTSGQNGEKLHLRINAVKAGQFKAQVFYVISKLGDQKQLWIGLVGN